MLIHDAVGGAFGNFLEIDPAVMNLCFQINTMGLLHLARRLAPAMIDLPWTRRLRPDAPDGFFIQPAAIADEVWHVAHQDRSAWSFDVEIRPFGEVW